MGSELIGKLKDLVGIELEQRQTAINTAIREKVEEEQSLAALAEAEAKARQVGARNFKEKLVRGGGRNAKNEKRAKGKAKKGKQTQAVDDANKPQIDGKSSSFVPSLRLTEPNHKKKATRGALASDLKTNAKMKTARQPLHVILYDLIRHVEHAKVHACVCAYTHINLSTYMRTGASIYTLSLIHTSTYIYKHRQELVREGVPLHGLISFVKEKPREIEDDPDAEEFLYGHSLVDPLTAEIEQANSMAMEIEAGVSTASSAATSTNHGGGVSVEAELLESARSVSLTARSASSNSSTSGRGNSNKGDGKRASVTSKMASGKSRRPRRSKIGKKLGSGASGDDTVRALAATSMFGAATANANMGVSVGDTIGVSSSRTVAKEMPLRQALDELRKSEQATDSSAASVRSVTGNHDKDSDSRLYQSFRDLVILQVPVPIVPKESENKTAASAELEAEEAILSSSLLAASSLKKAGKIGKAVGRNGKAQNRGGRKPGKKSGTNTATAAAQAESTFNLPVALGDNIKLSVHDLTADHQDFERWGAKAKKIDIPKADESGGKEKVDMRMYRNLLEKLPSASVNVPVMLYCMFEQVSINISRVDLTTPVLQKGESDDLESYLENALTGVLPVAGAAELSTAAEKRERELLVTHGNINGSKQEQESAPQFCAVENGVCVSCGEIVPESEFAKTSHSGGAIDFESQSHAYVAPETELTGYCPARMGDIHVFGPRNHACIHCGLKKNKNVQSVHGSASPPLPSPPPTAMSVASSDISEQGFHHEMCPATIGQFHVYESDLCTHCQQPQPLSCSPGAKFQYASSSNPGNTQHRADMDKVKHKDKDNHIIVSDGGDKAGASMSSLQAITSADPLTYDDGEADLDLAFCPASIGEDHTFLRGRCKRCGHAETGADVASPFSFEAAQATANARKAADTGIDTDTCPATIGEKHHSVKGSCVMCGMHFTTTTVSNTASVADSKVITKINGDSALFCPAFIGELHQFVSGVCVHCNVMEPLSFNNTALNASASISSVITDMPSSRSLNGTFSTSLCPASMSGGHSNINGRCANCGEKRSGHTHPHLHTKQQHQRTVQEGLISTTRVCPALLCGLSAVASARGSGHGGIVPPSQKKETYVISSADRELLHCARGVLDGTTIGTDTDARVGWKMERHPLLVEAERYMDEFFPLPGVNRRCMPDAATKSMAQRGLEQTELLNKSDLPAGVFSRGLTMLNFQEMLNKPSADVKYTHADEDYHFLIDHLSRGSESSLVEAAVLDRMRLLKQNKEQARTVLAEAEAEERRQKRQALERHRRHLEDQKQQKKRNKRKSPPVGAGAAGGAGAGNVGEMGGAGAYTGLCDNDIDMEGELQSLNKEIAEILVAEDAMTKADMCEDEDNPFVIVSEAKDDKVRLQRDWRLGHDRVYSEYYTPHILKQILFHAMPTFIPTLHCEARYSPMEDALLVLMHADTPLTRKRFYNWNDYLCPDMNFGKWLATSKSVKNNPPIRMYNLYQSFTGHLRDASEVFYPCDRGQLGVTKTQVGEDLSSRIWLVKDQNVISLEKFSDTMVVADADTGADDRSMGKGKKNAATSVPSKGTIMNSIFQEDGSRLTVTTKVLSGAGKTGKTGKTGKEMAVDVDLNVDMKITYTTASNLVVDVCSDNSVYMRYPVDINSSAYTKATSGSSSASSTKEKELWRCITPQGVVIREMLDGSTILLLPDGNVSIKRAGSPTWLTTNNSGTRSVSHTSPLDAHNRISISLEGGRARKHTKNGVDSDSLAPIDVATEYDSETNAWLCTREDMVMYILYDGGSSLAQHADGTRIYVDRYADKRKSRVVVEAPGFVPVSFEEDALLTLADTASSSSSSSSSRGLGAGLTDNNIDSEVDAMSEIDSETEACVRGKSTFSSSLNGISTVTRNRLQSNVSNAALRWQKITNLFIHLHDGTSLSRKGPRNMTAVENKTSGVRFYCFPHGKIVYAAADIPSSAMPSSVIDGLFDLHGLPKETYVLDTVKGTIRTDDREDNSFCVSITGKSTGVLYRDKAKQISLKMDQSKGMIKDEGDGMDVGMEIPLEFYPPPANPIPPRLFIINGDGSGHELLDSSAVKESMRRADIDPNVAILPPEQLTSSSEKQASLTSKQASSMLDSFRSKQTQEVKQKGKMQAEKGTASALCGDNIDCDYDPLADDEDDDSGDDVCDIPDFLDEEELERGDQSPRKKDRVQTSISQKLLASLAPPRSYVRKPVIPNVIKSSLNGIIGHDNSLGDNSGGGSEQSRYNFVTYRNIIQHPPLQDDQLQTVYNDRKQYREWKETQDTGDQQFHVAEHHQTEEEKAETLKLQNDVIMARQVRNKRLQDMHLDIAELKTHTLDNARSYQFLPRLDVTSNISAKVASRAPLPALKKTSLVSSYSQARLAPADDDVHSVLHQHQQRTMASSSSTKSLSFASSSSSITPSSSLASSFTLPKSGLLVTGAREPLKFFSHEHAQPAKSARAMLSPLHKRANKYTVDGTTTDTNDIDDGTVNKHAGARLLSGNHHSMHNHISSTPGSSSLSSKELLVPSSILKSTLRNNSHPRPHTHHQSSRNRARYAREKKERKHTANAANTAFNPSRPRSGISRVKHEPRLVNFFQNEPFNNHFETAQVLETMRLACVPQNISGSASVLALSRKMQGGAHSKDERKHDYNAVTRDLSPTEKELYVTRLSTVIDCVSKLGSCISRVLSYPSQANLRTVHLMKSPYAELLQRNPILHAHAQPFLFSIGFEQTLSQPANVMVYNGSHDDLRASLLKLSSVLRKLAQQAQSMLDGEGDNDGGIEHEDETMAELGTGAGTDFRNCHQVNPDVSSDEESDDEPLLQQQQHDLLYPQSQHGINAMPRPQTTAGSTSSTSSSIRSGSGRRAQTSHGSRRQRPRQSRNSYGIGTGTGGHAAAPAVNPLFTGSVTGTGAAYDNNMLDALTNAASSRSLRSVRSASALLNHSTLESTSKLSQASLYAPRTYTPAVRSVLRKVDGSMRKESSVKLPAALRAAVTPQLNVNNLMINAGAKQRTRVSSTYRRAQSNLEAIEFANFVLQPAMINLGVLQLGFTYRVTISLTNTGVASGRFSVAQPSNDLYPDSMTHARVLVRPGIVAPGMKKRLELELYAGEEGNYANEVTLTTAKLNFTIPIRGTIVNQRGTTKWDKVKCKERSRQGFGENGQVRLYSKFPSFVARKWHAQREKDRKQRAQEQENDKENETLHAPSRNLKSSDVAPNAGAEVGMKLDKDGQSDATRADARASARERAMLRTPATSLGEEFTALFHQDRRATAEPKHYRYTRVSHDLAVRRQFGLELNPNTHAHHQRAMRTTCAATEKLLSDVLTKEQFDEDGERIEKSASEKAKARNKLAASLGKYDLNKLDYRKYVNKNVSYDQMVAKVQKDVHSPDFI